MNDRSPVLLPKLERMLASAATGRTVVPTAGRRSLSRPRGGLTRIAAIGAACLAFAGTAMAATGIWNPVVGDPDDPPVLSNTPVQAALSAQLGVLRRDQTDQDRSPEVEATLNGAQVPDGVRLDSVRFLAPGVNGEATILVSGVKAAPYETKEEPLCVLRPAPGDGPAAGLCFDLSMLTSDHARATDVDVTSNSGVAYGVVPDGVATVTAEFGSAPDATVPVADNYWELPVGGAELSNANGYGGVQRTVWRDADGNVVAQGSGS